jgi:outer membrane lipoprotein carrier protein
MRIRPGFRLTDRLSKKCLERALEGRGFSLAVKRVPTLSLTYLAGLGTAGLKPRPSEARNPTCQHPAKSGARRAGLVLAACALLASTAWMGSALTPAASVAPALDNYIRQFETSYRDVRTLRANFTQEYSAWDRNRIESGVVYLARGGKMRWEYQKQEQKLFLSDGKDVLLYVPSEKQLTRTPIKESGDVRVPFEILVSHLNLRRAFSKIEFVDSAHPIQPGDRVLRAYPKRGYEEVYKDVVVELTPAFDIRRLAVSYPDGTSMEFTFDHISRNVPVQPSMFEFAAPPGTEVIQQ